MAELRVNFDIRDITQVQRVEKTFYITASGAFSEGFSMSRTGDEGTPEGQFWWAMGPSYRWVPDNPGDKIYFDILEADQDGVSGVGSIEGPGTLTLKTLGILGLKYEGLYSVP